MKTGFNNQQESVFLKSSINTAEQKIVPSTFEQRSVVLSQQFYPARLQGFITNTAVPRLSQDNGCPFPLVVVKDAAGCTFKKSCVFKSFVVVESKINSLFDWIEMLPDSIDLCWTLTCRRSSTSTLGPTSRSESSDCLYPFLYFWMVKENKQQNRRGGHNEWKDRYKKKC